MYLYLHLQLADAFIRSDSHCIILYIYVIKTIKFSRFVYSKFVLRVNSDLPQYSPLVPIRPLLWNFEPRSILHLCSGNRKERIIFAWKILIQTHATTQTRGDRYHEMLCKCLTHLIGDGDCLTLSHRQLIISNFSREIIYHNCLHGEVKHKSTQIC